MNFGEYRKSSDERILGTPFDGPVIPFGAVFFLKKSNIYHRQKSSSSVRYKGGSRNIPRIRAELWRLDHHGLADIENFVVSEVHVERFKSKEVGINIFKNLFLF